MFTCECTNLPQCTQCNVNPFLGQSKQKQTGSVLTPCTVLLIVTVLLQQRAWRLRLTAVGLWHLARLTFFFFFKDRKICKIHYGWTSVIEWWSLLFWSSLLSSLPLHDGCLKTSGTSPLLQQPKSCSTVGVNLSFSPSLYICELETTPKTMSPWYKTALWTALFVFLFFLIHFNSVHCSMNYILEWLKLKRPFHLTRLFLSMIQALSEAVLGSVSSLIYPMVDRLCKCYEIAFTKLSCSSNSGFTLYLYDK